MKTLAFAALFVGATGLLACGGGGDDDGPMFPVDGGGGDGTCNPATQQGCAEGEKCSWIIAQVQPTFLGQTVCVRDGNVALGGACTDNCIPKGSTDIGPECDTESGVVPDSTANPPIIGTDNCAAGGVCINGACTEICQGADSCGAEAACVGYGDLFTDNEGVGACSPTCDPLVQDCGEGKACTVDPSPGAGFATCEAELNPDRTQNAPCPAGMCSLNGCAAGFGPWLPKSMTEALCTRISRTGESYLDDPEGLGPGGDRMLAEGSLPWGGPVAGGEEFSCKGPAVQDKADLNSFFLQAFYSDTQDTPAEWGICGPTGVTGMNIFTWGNCESFALEYFWNTFNAAEMEEPESGATAVRNLCAAEEVCGHSCVSNAKWDELTDAYCVANPETPLCVEEAARSRVRQIVLDGAGPKRELPVLKRERRLSW